MADLITPNKLIKKKKSFNKLLNIPNNIWYKLSSLQKNRILSKYYNGYKITYIDNKIIINTKK